MLGGSTSERGDDDRFEPGLWPHVVTAFDSTMSALAGRVTFVFANERRV